VYEVLARSELQQQLQRRQDDVSQFPTMSRVAIADRDDLRRGAWTAEEDEKLRAYVGSHGTGHWRSVGRKAGTHVCLVL
jgi:hypothetical protein